MASSTYRTAKSRIVIFKLNALRWIVSLGLSLLFTGNIQAQDAKLSVPASAPRYSLRPYQLGIVINAEDPNSVEVGDYYRRVRHVPAKNVVRVKIPLDHRTLSASEFSLLKQQIESSLDNRVQAVVLVWTAPWAVECNSITSALTMGFDAELCQHTCGQAKFNPYFDSRSTRPYSDFGMRLSMLLPTQSVELAKSLIERGLHSDHSFPHGTAYLLSTSDLTRSSRSPGFPKSGHILRPLLAIENLHADSIEDKNDVMFYFTGLVSVPKLETLNFLPGAIADHLTSAGGELLDSSQMSSLRWIEAGAIASYGTVSEPCNYPQKFPNPTTVMKHYLLGATALEAYWKSVAWPAQGVFIGEPLASPFQH